MTTRTVTFSRSWSGPMINFWIYHPNDVTEKLIFTNGFASSSLEEGVEYLLFWIASGTAGTELKVERRVAGVDSSAQPLVKSWKMPAKKGAPLGKILTFQKSVTLQI